MFLLRSFLCCNFFRIPRLLTFIAIASGSALTSAETDTLTTEIMTLDEAAQFLRMPVQELGMKATKKILPGRRFGEDWRFSRSVLLLWMSGKSPEALLEKAESRDKSKMALSHNSLASISGRGTKSGASKDADNDSNQTNPEEIGAAPDYQSAENVFLRDQAVLLKSGQMTLELDLFYSRNERQNLVSTFSPFLGSVEVQADTKQDIFTANMNFRYGVLDDFQIFAGIPYVSRSDIVNLGNQQISDTTENTWGDITMGVRYAVLAEGWGYPSVVLSAEGLLPTRDAPYNFGGSIALTKSIDPAVLFANFGYRHWVNDGVNDLTKIQPDNQFNMTLGIAYALNDTLTLSTSFSGVFNSEIKLNETTFLQNSERFSLQFGVTSMIFKNFFVEPFVTFGLNGQNSDMTFGIKIPYTFDL